MTLVIHAPNIHQGGGRSLLIPLLRAIDGQCCQVVVDARLELPDRLGSGVVLSRVPPTLFRRLAAEWKLRRLAKAGDDLLCFGNLPPLFSSRARVLVFLQNRYLVDRTGLRDLPWWPRLRTAVERVWLRRRLRRAKVIVQTPSMAGEVRGALGVDAIVLPFIASLPPRQSDGAPGVAEGNTDVIEKKLQFDFVYVASGEPHKNHRALIDAWCVLAGSGLRPSLCITLDPNQDGPLLDWIQRRCSQWDLEISNVGQITHEAVLKLYGQSRALLFPSLFESFGLPLVEAANMSLPILAPERDYVRDVVVPTHTFDPGSPISIARAVRRFIGVPESLPRALSPEEFLLKIQQDL